MAIIASIGGRQWVLGLEWSSYSGIPDRAELMKDAGTDDIGELQQPWYALRVTEEVMQAGFCEPIGDIVRPKRLASLAAMLADAKPQPWLGVYQIAEDLYWYIAVRDEYAVLPGGDVVGNADDISNALAQHLGYGGWNRDEGDLDDLNELLRSVKAKRTPIRSLAVSRLDPVPTAIAVAVVLSLSIGGLVAHHEYQEHERRARLEAARLKRPAKAVEHVVTASDYLAQSPMPSAWLEGCHQALNTVPPSRHGWLPQAAGCDVGAVNVRWTRGVGATIDLPPPGQLDDTGEASAQTIPFKARPDGIDNGADLRTERLALIAWAQRYGSAVTIGAAAPISASAAAGFKVPVTIPLPVSPFVPGNGFDQLPGLRLTGVAPTQNQQTQQSSQAAKGVTTWAVTGVLYAHQQ